MHHPGSYRSMLCMFEAIFSTPYLSVNLCVCSLPINSSHKTSFSRIFYYYYYYCYQLNSRFLQTQELITNNKRVAHLWDLCLDILGNRHIRGVVINKCIIQFEVCRVASIQICPCPPSPLPSAWHTHIHAHTHMAGTQFLIRGAISWTWITASASDLWKYKGTWNMNFHVIYTSPPSFFCLS